MKVTRRLEGPVLQDCPLERFDFQIDPYRGCGHLCRSKNDLQKKGPSHLSIHV